MTDLKRCFLGAVFVLAALIGGAGAAYGNFTVPLREGGPIHFVWVGDLDGDGDPDWVVDRPTEPHQRIEAYTHAGEFLWEVNFGPNSENKNNISPGSATISVGHWDGVTVSDLDGDGFAEVIVKFADGVTFGDGETFTDRRGENRQWIGVLDGRTGKLLDSARIPGDYLSVGPVAAHLGVGNLGIVASMKNRNPDKSFNLMVCNYVWDGTRLALAWTWHRRDQDAPDGHQIRIVDVNGDGVDDVAHIGFVLDGRDGSLLYSLGPAGVVHGDRFHIAKMDPTRPGLQGYGIQQDNPSGLLEYYYDAGTGEILWKRMGGISDVGRGDAADVDPRFPGYEIWSFHGMRNPSAGTEIASGDVTPWPSHRIWWDEDDQAEQFNDGKIEKWNYRTQSMERLVTTWHYEGATVSWRGQPAFYGDILGDWREEVVLAGNTHDKLVVFTPPGLSETRPPLREDQYYRNCLTIKGYTQSHHTSYYIGPWIPDGKYRLRNRATGHYLGSLDPDAEGAFVGQLSGESDQAIDWLLESKHGHRVWRAADGSAYLDGLGNEGDGSVVGQGGERDDPAQQWIVEHVAENFYRVVNRATDKALDTGGHGDPGAKVEQWFVNPSPNQQWELIEFPPLTNAEAEDVRLRFRFEGEQTAVATVNAEIRPSRPGRLYGFQFTSDLSAGPWVNLGEPMAGDGGALEFSVPVTFENPRGFYRLSIRER